MSLGGDSRAAEKKFWNSPELVENLVLMLDALTTFHLAQIHNLTLQVVQHPPIWNSLVRWSFPTNNGPLDQETFLANREKLEPLVAILDLLEASQSHQMRMDLLDTICQRFPGGAGDKLDISLDCHHSNHTVSPLGFLLLEEVSVDEVEIVRIKPLQLKDTLLSAVSARVVSQQKIVEELSVQVVQLHTSQDVASLHTTVKHCQAVDIDIDIVEVNGEIGEGWGRLVEVVQSPNWAPPHGGCLSVTREAMVGGERGDLRSIWDALRMDGYIHTWSSLKKSRYENDEWH